MSENKKKGQSKVRPHICKRCGAHKGVISKYGMNICRRCFKDNAETIGFRKYD